jgi:hypothetical protein
VTTKIEGRKPRFLVFCRHFLMSDFHASFDPVSDRFDFGYVTDAGCPGARDTRPVFYRALNAGEHSDELTDEDIANVVDRCRLLRNLERGQAIALAHAMAVALGEEFDRFKPDAVLSQLVDEYSTHIASLIAARRGLGYLGYCAGYFPGTVLLLADAYGRPYNWRDADVDEVAAHTERVSGVAFRQTYNLGASYGRWRHWRSVARYQVKRAWFGWRVIRERDPWGMHYRILPFIAERRRLADFPSDRLFDSDWEASLAAQRRRRPNTRVVYLPLSYFPEATIDYWVGDKRMIQYEAEILRMVTSLARDAIVIVKEHLHMMGARPIRFLEGLRGIPGVISVPPLAFSNAVVAASDVVILGSGSPGIEATIRGKPVFSFCDTSYWFTPSGGRFLDLGRVEGWFKSIENSLAVYKPFDDVSRQAFVRECLRSSTLSTTTGVIWPVMTPEQADALLTHMASRRDR